MTYTEKLNELNASARNELSQLLLKCGQTLAGDYYVFVSHDCEELLAESSYKYTDYPLVLSYLPDVGVFALRNSGEPHRTTYIESTDDLCILADYVRNKPENNMYDY